ncbi:MAG: hypothetical protein RSC29_01520, partial [Oscillospiraceae bacterium]
MRKHGVFKSIVAGALISSFLIFGTSCGQKKEEPAPAKTSFVFAQDDLNFTWYDNSDIAAATMWADTSKIEQWIKDNKKVTIKYMDPGGASAEKLATMIVSDEFPDVITMLRGQDSEKLISSGKVIPLNQFMDKYKNMSTTLSQNGILKMMEYKDGKNYEIPNWANIGKRPTGNNAWVLNSKIYTELGRPEIKSFDDLYNYLKKVKEKYPDIIPYETTDVFQGERYVMAGMA